MPPNLFSGLRYSPFLAQTVVIRRCHLACGDCSEFDKTPADLREQFYAYKSCNQTCTVGGARSSSQRDNWRAWKNRTQANDSGT